MKVYAKNNALVLEDGGVRVSCPLMGSDAVAIAERLGSKYLQAAFDPIRPIARRIRGMKAAGLRFKMQTRWANTAHHPNYINSLQVRRLRGGWYFSPHTPRAYGVGKYLSTWAELQPCEFRSALNRALHVAKQHLPK